MSIANEVIVQHNNLSVIGIKLDIQNYEAETFFGSFLERPASPPTGAVAGRNGIAEFGITYGYDPDDSYMLSCDLTPPNGNWDFYCNHQFDALYQQELAAPDPGVRQNIFDQIHQLYLTEFPFITLYSPLWITPVHRGTHNYQPNPFEGEAINAWEWWCDRGKC